MTAVTLIVTLSRVITSCGGTVSVTIRKSTFIMCEIKGGPRNSPGPFAPINRPSTNITAHSDYCTTRIVRKDRSLVQVGRDTAGVQYKRTEVLQRMLPCRLKGSDDRLAKIVFRHGWEGLHKRFPIETDAMVVENHEKGGEIRVMLN